jgi:hypothetical protein
MKIVNRGAIAAAPTRFHRPKVPMKSIVAGFALALSLTTVAHAAAVSAFAEDFEGTLAAWTDRSPGNPQAAIFVDPLNANNHVLGFRQLGSGGSIFSTTLIAAAGQFTVSFDYLGLAGRGGVAGDIGGYFGIDTGFPQNEVWIAGTGSYVTPVALIDDSQWHTYTLTFSSTIGQQVHLKFEDWDGSHGVAGDAFFDNVRFNDALVAPAALPHAQNAVPEPSSLALLAVAATALGITTRRRRAKQA